LRSGRREYRGRGSYLVCSGRRVYRFLPTRAGGAFDRRCAWTLREQRSCTEPEICLAQQIERYLDVAAGRTIERVRLQSSQLALQRGLAPRAREPDVLDVEFLVDFFVEFEGILRQHVRRHGGNRGDKAGKESDVTEVGVIRHDARRRSQEK